MITAGLLSGKARRRTPFLLLTAAIVSGGLRAAGAPDFNPHTPVWAKDLVIMEIAPKSFTSPNGPESGTFTSAREKIPYLKDLGINGVWFAGHNLADPRHFYNIWTQYAAIRPDVLDPSLGTPEAFKAMVDDFHKHGIRVFLDVITHGVMKNSPLIKEHPEWFRGGSWGMTDYNWNGRVKGLDDWWVKTHTEYVTKYGVDGYRLDLTMPRPDLWDRIKRNAREAGHPIVVFIENTNPSRGLADFFQRATRLAGQTGGFGFDGPKLLKDAAAYYQTPPVRIAGKPAAVLNACNLSCHDEGWGCFPKNESPYLAEGSRCVFGYGCLFLPAIPLFMSGEEFDADHRPLPNLSDKLFGKTPAKGKWLYGSWIQWNRLKEKRHREMLADVKKMLAIRRREKAVIRAVRNDGKIDIASVPCRSDVEVPVPYVLWGEGRAILVAGNRSDRDARVTAELPLKTAGLGGAAKIRVTDLWNGGERTITAQEAAAFAFPVKRDKVAGGGLAVFRLEPAGD